MQSSGGLTDAARAGAHAALTVLSGPAGGVGGALLLAELAGEPDVLCFDMGGTSCDVCLIDGCEVAETAERVIAGRPLALPALDIHTVGAGGGSIAWRDAGGALRVGPASAGARPGPACYGRGGTEPTVTDANLLLGRLLEDVAARRRADARPRRRRAGLAAPRGRARPRRARLRRGDRAGGRGRDAGRAAADDGRARDRPARLRADAVRRRRPAARGLAGGRARHLHGSSARAPRGVLCALGLAAAAPRRDVVAHADARPRRAHAASVCRASAPRSSPRPARQLSDRAGARARPPRAALPRPVLRAAGRRGALAGRAPWLGPAALREAFERGARAALRLPRRARPRSSS